MKAPSESGGVASDEAWRVLRHRSRLLWLLLFASLPAIAVLSWLLDSAFGQSRLSYLVTLAFVTAIGVAGLRVASFACPRCGRPYFESWYFFQLLRKEIGRAHV